MVTEGIIVVSKYNYILHVIYTVHVNFCHTHKSIKCLGSKQHEAIQLKL